MALAGARLLLSLPRDATSTAVPPRSPIDFGESEFKDHFRFGRADFFRLLSALGLANPNNMHAPRYMRIGRRLARTDWALMLLLKRLASPSPYKDLRWILGGSKTLLCACFLHMLQLLHTKFCSKCTSLLPWQDYMLDFERMLQDAGSVFDGLIGLVDGHFM